MLVPMFPRHLLVLSPESRLCNCVCSCVWVTGIWRGLEWAAHSRSRPGYLSEGRPRDSPRRVRNLHSQQEQNQGSGRGLHPEWLSTCGIPKGKWLPCFVSCLFLQSYWYLQCTLHDLKSHKSTYRLMESFFSFTKHCKTCVIYNF